MGRRTQRYSKQREAVFNAVKSTDSHPSAEDVYESVRREIPNISLGTVYRNLSRLADSGKISTLELPDEVTRYDGNTSDHLHGICQECGRVVDVELSVHQNLHDYLSGISNFHVSRYSLTLHGLCRDCLN